MMLISDSDVQRLYSLKESIDRESYEVVGQELDSILRSMRRLGREKPYPEAKIVFIEPSEYARIYPERS